MIKGLIYFAILVVMFVFIVGLTSISIAAYEFFVDIFSSNQQDDDDNFI